MNFYYKRFIKLYAIGAFRVAIYVLCLVILLISILFQSFVFLVYESFMDRK